MADSQAQGVLTLAEPFRILTVCTGNICRSPQAQQLLFAQLNAVHDPGVDWKMPIIESAGTGALVERAMPEEAALWSREFGGDPTDHFARQLTAQMIEESDLVIAMAREHRSAIARLLPRASRYTFTLRELARILGGTRQAAFGGDGVVVIPPPGAFADWASLASARRGYFAGTSADDDVVDPYRREATVYKESAEQVRQAVTTLVNSVVVRP